MRKTEWINDAELFANWQYIPRRRDRVAGKAVTCVFGKLGSGLMVGVMVGASAAAMIVGVSTFIKWMVS